MKTAEQIAAIIKEHITDESGQVNSEMLHDEDIVIVNLQEISYEYGIQLSTMCKMIYDIIEYLEGILNEEGLDVEIDQHISNQEQYIEIYLG